MLARTLQVWTDRPMPCISQIMDIRLYFARLEQLFDAIERPYRQHLLAFNKSGGSYSMPLIVQVVNICLHLTGPEKLPDGID